MKIEKDRYTIIINGKREFIWCGAIHYYRLPVVERWPKTLKMLKEAGLNAVDIYFPWNYHTEEEGKYRFDGNRDVERLLDEVEKAGLYLVARPGPYICSEIDGGGLPAWLLAKPEPILRCRREGKVVYDDKYMIYVRQWWEQIVPRIAARKNLILFQIENEFNLLPHLNGPMKNIITAIRKYDANMLFKLSNSDIFKMYTYKIMPKFSKQTADNSVSNPYMKKLYEWSRKLGVEVPIFHNDILSTADRQTDVDLMSIDDYPITDLTSEWRTRKNVFNAADIIEEGHAAFRREEPIFAAEFQSSWYDSWGGPGYEKVRELLGTEQLDIATKTLLAQRGTLVSYFMFAGGTTRGYLSSPDVYTSYDMAAPITESGEISERYRVVQWLIKEVAKLGDDFLTTDPDPNVVCRPSRIFCKARKSKNLRYIFLRNVGGAPAAARLNCYDKAVRIGRAEMRIIVLDPNGNLVGEVGPYAPAAVTAKKKAPPSIPPLDDWTLSWAGPQLDPAFDASAWPLMDPSEKWDLDSLGLHYGFCWCRGTFKGRLSRLLIDARHCFSVYINGRLVASRDNFRNFSGVGDDVAELFDIPIPFEVQHAGTNAIVVLVESLGHNKDFENDARNPRGIVSLKSSGAKIVWRYRGGLIDGERGLCPELDRKCFDAYAPKTKVSLPHFWAPEEEGLGLYETTFKLDIKDVDPAPVGVVIPEAYSKANIYVNGVLMGRYWHEKGPQRKFYVPWGILNPRGENHICVAVWKRWEAGGLGKVSLEPY
ncbi:MAG: beta-galactosidase [bacterium]